MDNTIAKFIRLKNGDDLIAEAFETSDDTGDYITVINPLKALYVPSPSSGYLQIAFMPWVYPRICEHQEFNIKKDEILLYEDVASGMNEYYWESLDNYLNNKEDVKEKIKKEDKEEESRLQQLLDMIKSEKVYH